MRMAVGLFIGTVLLLSYGAFSAIGASPPRVEIVEMSSKVFGNVRNLRVWLPSGYDDGSARALRYPALLMNDGQTLFEAKDSNLPSGKEWSADETASRLVDSGEIGPFILVGIDNAGLRERAKEYLPYFDEFLEPPLKEPQGRLYPEFLERDVIPFLEGRYRIDTSRLGIGGASYGALVALYASIHLPGRFRYLLLESPSLYVSEAQVLKEAARMRDWPAKIFLGVGTNEAGLADCDPGEIQGDINLEAVSDVKKLANTLESAGILGDALHLEVGPCARHGEEAWGRRLSIALRHLFGPP